MCLVSVTETKWTLARNLTDHCDGNTFSFASFVKSSFKSSRTSQSWRPKMVLRKAAVQGQQLATDLLPAEYRLKYCSYTLNKIYELNIFRVSLPPLSCREGKCYPKLILLFHMWFLFMFSSRACKLMISFACRSCLKIYVLAMCRGYIIYMPFPLHMSNNALDEVQDQFNRFSN